ncbi:hypothetical protein MJO28_015323 [Puccinia striiformis f. sp. tritici]|uniref:Uncharacterized protein n=2 Tax=Puccinia striiformis f. sp. tritici TaxID=168172 RepID=A0A0L0V5A8_9BASI|nr:hypothetical protein Pst134EB_028673 [Puccinia striiformis f. sp. tritici]KAI7934226.1 hypothetical protein MJO29_016476 [Puccinia striiformis f. sp. tritici]KAI7938403.1 hypothetical protein MJO28_015323 [Puccinia striiformis f. sp. tritici]KAI9617824.1 hypothetical protein H4Q26_012688 [Puccinia striiformis f. sp. tritici PST-130]KNE94460.1 hypothetical protein PSTG_12182 [Puccinia striiformis f. sp. tritici PST-78]
MVPLKLYNSIDPAWDVPKDDSDEEDMPSSSAPHSTAPLLCSASPTNADPAYLTLSSTLASSSGTPKVYNLAATGSISVTHPTEAPVSQLTPTEYEQLLNEAKLADYLEYLRDYDSLQNHLD